MSASHPPQIFGLFSLISGPCLAVAPLPQPQRLIVFLCCSYADTMPQVLVTPLLTYTTANETQTSFWLCLQGKSSDCLLRAAQSCPESGEGASFPARCKSHRPHRDPSRPCSGRQRGWLWVSSNWHRINGIQEGRELIGNS